MWFEAFIVGNPKLFCSHTLDHVGCMQLSLGLSRSIVADKQVLKNNKDIIENINLENKATYLWFRCFRIDSN